MGTFEAVFVPGRAFFRLLGTLGVVFVPGVQIVGMFEAVFVPDGVLRGASGHITV